MLERLPAPALTLSLALAGASLWHPLGRRALGLSDAAHSPATVIRSVAVQPANAAASTDLVPHVWLVETNERIDLYSNGLRVENRYVRSGQTRKYLAFSRSLPASDGEWRDQPAGIVFHTTESHIAPFQEDQNRALRRDGEGVLDYVRRNASYHFVIDRFGRVFRIMQESDCANHAGNSLWADDKWIYIYLNRSFFGVAFEARSSSEGEGPPVNAAQVHAGRILTEMLRSRYGIPAENCVTHAQVSVNPGNRRAGYHTDWAANLPYRDLGLSDNYARPLPSVVLFGFEAESLRAQAAGSPLEQGLQAAEDAVEQEAKARGLAVEQYRRMLQMRFREMTQALHGQGAPEENNL